MAVKIDPLLEARKKKYGEDAKQEEKSKQEAPQSKVFSSSGDPLLDARIKKYGTEPRQYTEPPTSGHIVSGAGYEAAAKKSAVDTFLKNTGGDKILGAPSLGDVIRATPQSFAAKNAEPVETPTLDRLQSSMRSDALTEPGGAAGGLSMTTRQEAEDREKAARQSYLDAQSKIAQVDSNPTDANIRAALSEYLGARQDYKRAETLSDTYRYLDRGYQNTVNPDTFWGQTKANYVQGRIGQDASLAWNEYLDNPTEENYIYATMLDELQAKNAENNREALDDVNTKFSAFSKDFAQYLPQRIDQTKYGIAGAAVGGFLGAAAGAPAAGIKAGITASSGVYSYQTMRGAAYKNLREMGIDDEIARDLAADEAFISSLIEMGDTALDLATLGGGKLINAAAGHSAKVAAAKGAVDKLTAKLTKRIGATAAAQFVNRALSPAAKQVLKAGIGLGLNVLGEGMEEYSQEAVSAANEERAKAGKTTGLVSDASKIFWNTITGQDDTYKQRFNEAFRGGAVIALIGGGGEVMVNNLATGAVTTLQGKYVAKNYDGIGADKLISDAIDLQGESAETAKKLQVRMREGKPVTNYELGKLYQQVRDEIQVKRTAGENMNPAQAQAQEEDAHAQDVRSAQTIAEQQTAKQEYTGAAIANGANASDVEEVTKTQAVIEEAMARSEQQTPTAEQVLGVTPQAPIFQQETQSAAGAFASGLPAAEGMQANNLSTQEQSPVQPISEAREDLQRMANTLGESGSKAMMGAFDDSRNAADFAADFTRVYNAAMNDQKIPETGLSPAQRQAAIYAGLNDAAEAVAKQQRQAIESEGKASGLVRDTYTDNVLDQKVATQLDRVAKLLGTSVRFANEVKGGKANAEITGNEVIIEKYNPNPVRFLLGHEWTHRVQALAPEAYNAFRNFIASDVASEVSDIKDLYARNDVQLSDEEALDEAVANYAGRMLLDQDGKLLDDFIERNKQNKTLLEKFRDAIREIVAKLTGAEKRMAQTAEGKLNAALDAAAKNAGTHVEEAAHKYCMEVINSDAVYDFSVSQKDINDYVDKAYEKANDEDHKRYLRVNERLVKDVSNEIKDIDEYVHALRDNDIRHIRNSHGEQTNEKYPVTAEDQKAIPDIVQNYDKVIVKERKGVPGLVYVKVIDDNLVYYLEAVTEEYHNEKLLVNKQMIKTGLDDIPELVGLRDAIEKRQSLDDFLADLKEIHEAYAQSASQTGTVFIDIVRQDSAPVNSTSTESEAPGFGEGLETYYSLKESNPEDRKTLEFLNRQKTQKVYRAMQLIDGKLYPPMAARVKDESGKKNLVEASELGAWEQAVERPDLIKNGNKFELDKANGSSIAAAYNPYFHTSRSPLNDQFSSAYKRDNIVIVEGEIPESELTSGYKAQYAKDAVGEMKWHSGPVSSKLKGDKARRVILSRWFKPVRIVSNAEVAQTIKGILDGENISIPYNTVTPSLRAELEKIGVPVTGEGTKYSIKGTDGETIAEIDNGTAVKYSLKTWTETDISKLRTDLTKAGFKRKQVDKWINDVNGVAAYIAANTNKLDYVAADNQTAMKSDEEYIYTIDFSTLCAKRLLYQGVYNAIQHALPNYAIMPGDTLLIRHIMNEKGYEVPCGFCYVESRRKLLGKFSERWLNEVGREKYGLRNADISTTDGLERLRTTNPEAYDEYTAWMRGRGSANPKVVELRTAYNEGSGILNLTPSMIETLKRIGGLRMQSFSDFEIPHVIDMMQVIMDMSRKELTSQAYTKVPAFAYIFGDTGVKINLSVVADVDANGNLVFDDKEGMDHNEAFKIRDMYDKNCGTILVGKNEDQIRAAMEDSRIDFIIPFHRSGWGKAEFRVLGLRGYQDFQSIQGEFNVDYSPLSPHRKKASGFLFPEDYWDPKASGNENTVNYLKKCREMNRVPRFMCFAFEPSVARDFVEEYNSTHANKISERDLLTADGMSRLCRNTKSYAAKGLRQIAFDYLEYGLDHGAKVQDGYWKTLVDFRMYDNNGKPAPQQTVKPNFNMEYARKFMEEYDGDPNNLPVAQDVVDEFVELAKNKETGKYLRRLKDAERRYEAEMGKASAPKYSLKNSDYMAAVNNNDTETAQKMVDEAAEVAFTDSKVRGADGKLMTVYHGTNADFNVFDPKAKGGQNGTAEGFGIYLTDNPDVSKSYGDRQLKLYADIKRPAYSNKKTIKQGELAKVIKESCVRQAERMVQEDGYDSVKDALLDTWISNYIYTYGYRSISEAYADAAREIIRANGSDSDIVQELLIGQGIRDYDRAMDFYHDVLTPITGIDGIWTTWKGSDGTKSNVILAFDSSQIKSAEPITRDDSGNVIPLNDRFKKSTGDIRYSLKEDQDYMAAVESGDTKAAQKMVDTAAKAAGYTVKGYHGTDREFTKFSKAKRGRNYGGSRLGPGFYFAHDASDAAGWTDGDRIVDAWLSIKNPLDLRKGVPAGLEKEIRARTKNQSEIERSLENPEGFLMGFIDDNDGVQKFLASLGYDGIITDEEIVVFEPEQIKSAEPVTRDGKGNVIPLSKRFNLAKGDMRYSLKGSERPTEAAAVIRDSNELKKMVSDYKALQKDLAKQTARADRAEAQLKRTELPTVREDDVRKLAKEQIAEMGSSVKASDITGRLVELGNYIVQGGVDGTLTYDDVKEKAVDIARDIVSGAKELTNSAELEAVQKVRQYLKGKKFYFDNTLQWRKNAPGYMAKNTTGKGEFTDYKYLHAKNLGRFTLTADPNATQIDDAWAEMQQMFGEEWFPDDVTTVPAMITYISDLLDNVEPVYDNPYSYDMAEVIEYEANRIIEGLISEQVRQTAPTYVDKMEKALAKEKFHAAEALRRVREQRDRQLAAVHEHYRQMAEDKLRRKDDSAQRTRLLKIAKRLYNKKLPAVTRAKLNEYIGDLDLVAKGITGKSIEKLTDLKEWYEDRQENDPDFIRDEHIEKAIARLSKRHIADLTQSEVAELTEVLLNIENELRTEKKLIDSKVKHDIAVAGAQIITDVENSRGSEGGVFNDMIATELLSPEREAKRLTGYNDNDPLLTATKELSAGQRKMFDYQRRANARFQKWINDKTFVREIAGKKAKEITITGTTNKGPVKVKITPAMRMSLYLHSLNDQNLKHISQGGITVPDMEWYKKGDLQKALDKGVTVRLTPSQVREITSQMTAQERTFALAAHDYFNGMSRDEINAVSEQLKGYSLAGVEDYFPINTDRNFLKREFDSIKQDGTIEGMGFLKERVNAANPIMLRDMNEVLDNSVKMHSKYIGLAIPVRNFGKLWNASTGGIDQEGKWKNYANSVQGAIAKKWGSSAKEYVERMMKDLNNSSSMHEIWGEKLAKVRSNYAGAVLSMNAGVALKQAASYPTAAAVVGWSPLLKAMKTPGNRRVDLDLVAKYTPLLWYRSQGYSSQELGDIKNQGKSLPKALNWIQAMDVWTTTKLWTAAEYYVRNNADLQQGSDAYYKKVAEIYNRIIEETQPNYTTMQRPQLLRSENELVKTVNMFKTQPFQNFNIIYDAIGDMRAKKAAYRISGKEEAKVAYDAAKKAAALAISSQLVSAVTFALMQFAWDAFRGKDDKYKDEEGEEKLAAFLKGIGLNMVSNGFGMLPYGGFLLELAESTTDKVLKELDKDPFFDATFYGLEASPLETVNDTAEGTVKLITETVSLLKGLASDDEETNFETFGRTVYQTAETWAQLLGQPVANVRKDLEALAYQFLKRTKGPLLGRYYSTRISSDPTKYSGDYYDLLYRAMKRDPQAYKQIYDLMLSDDAFGGNAAGEAFTDKKVKNAMETRMKKDQGVESVKDLSQRYLSPEQQKEYDETLSSLQMSSVWKKADDSQKGKALNALYDIAGETPEGEERQKAIEASGLSETEYLLYMTALDMVDKPNENGKLGTYIADEVEAALRMLDISDSKKDALWASKYKKAAPDW